MPLKRSTSGPWSPVFKRRLLLILGGVALLLAAGLALIVKPFWRLTSQFDDITYRQPSRLYARPPRLAAGERVDLDRLVTDLRAVGYRPGSGLPLAAGRYLREKSGLTVHLRHFAALGESDRGLVEARVTGGEKSERIAELLVNGHQAEAVLLEPPLLAAYYGDDFKERRPVKLSEVPKDLINAILAAEDSDFFSHSGISFTGIVRAAWVDVRGRGIRQGGAPSPSSW
jgi:penicillin-binding protein 1B